MRCKGRKKKTALLCVMLMIQSLPARSFANTALAYANTERREKVGGGGGGGGGNKGANLREGICHSFGGSVGKISGGLGVGAGH